MSMKKRLTRSPLHLIPSFLLIIVSRLVSYMKLFVVSTLLLSLQALDGVGVVPSKTAILRALVAQSLSWRIKALVVSQPMFQVLHLLSFSIVILTFIRTTRTTTISFPVEGTLLFSFSRSCSVLTFLLFFFFREKQLVEEKAKILESAPLTLLNSEALPDISQLDLLFKPSMGEMSTLALPENLPLDFIASKFLLTSFPFIHFLSILLVLS